MGPLQILLRSRKNHQNFEILDFDKKSRNHFKYHMGTLIKSLRNVDIGISISATIPSFSLYGCYIGCLGKPSPVSIFLQISDISQRRYLMSHYTVSDIDDFRYQTSVIPEICDIRYMYLRYQTSAKKIEPGEVFPRHPIQQPYSENKDFVTLHRTFWIVISQISDITDSRQQIRSFFGNSD